jgi:hypothetical protein
MRTLAPAARTRPPSFDRGSAPPAGLARVRAELGTALRRRRWWRDARRLRAEGVANAFARWQRWRGILRSAPVRADAPGSGPVEVHLLCHRLDYLSAMWALKTLFVTSAVRWPLVVHVQGTPGALMMRRLRAHFPDARIVTQAEADVRVAEALSAEAYPRLLDARRRSPFMMKLVDPAVLSSADSVVLVDSDVLFFRAPDALQAHVERGARDRCLFQRDPVSTYNIERDAAAAAFGVELPERVNTGIAAFPRRVVDFALCERLLEHPEVRRPTGWIEQTLFALCAGAMGQVEYLPADYLISLERGLDHGPLVARHYAGPSRPLLTEEGMPHAIARGLVDSA